MKIGGTLDLVARPPGKFADVDIGIVECRIDIGKPIGVSNFAQSADSRLPQITDIVAGAYADYRNGTDSADLPSPSTDFSCACQSLSPVATPTKDMTPASQRSLPRTTADSDRSCQCGSRRTSMRMGATTCFAVDQGADSGAPNFRSASLQLP
jgi:hypothetical protein